MCVMGLWYDVVAQSTKERCGVAREFVVGLQSMGGAGGANGR